MKKVRVITNIIIVAILVSLTVVAIPFSSSIRTSVNPNVIYYGDTNINKVSFMINVYWGTEYIEDMHRPMKFINIIASGSIKIEDIQAYLKAGAKAVGLGRALYKDATYDEITRRAKLALEKVKSV